MALNPTRLNVTEFDFDDVKDNLKIFLKGQTEFKDYDFEGSGMSALLDVLAYNTHYLGFNANMLANEMFLDSASLRSSIVSHAKTLGYIPTSSRAATATVDVTLNTTALTTATMEAGTVFTTTVDGTDYQFVTSTAVTASNTGAGITYNNIKIYEGKEKLSNDSLWIANQPCDINVNPGKPDPDCANFIISKIKSWVKKNKLRR